MKVRHYFSSAAAIIAVVIASSAIVAAQRLITPRPSQNASVSQSVGMADISITYSRPLVKGRTIFAEAPAEMAARASGERTLDNQNDRKAGEPIVPFGHVWRTGANEATLFTVSDDVLINGQPLTAGKYSLHSIPGKDEWTIIFNKDDGQWGSFTYDESKDALRVSTKPQWVNSDQEALLFTIEAAAPQDASEISKLATVNIRWANVSVPFTVEVRDPNGVARKRIAAQVAAAKADDWAIPFGAANWAKNSKDAETAAASKKWFERSLAAIDAQIKTKETFQNLQRRSSSLLALGRKDDAIAAAERAVVVGKADTTVKPADITALEKKIEELKAGK